MESADYKTHELIVVGAGPVGLSLALGLARKGRDVLVIEKDDTTVQHSRAPAIWPGTQEILADLGVIDTFLDKAIVMDEVELRNADRNSTLLTLPLMELESFTPYPYLLVLPQSQTEQILLSALQNESTAKVLFSGEVVDLVQHPSKVEVHFQQGEGKSKAFAKYVAGCDGAHSTVRNSIHASMEGTTYSFCAGLADIEIEKGRDFHSPRLSTRSGLAIAIGMGEGLWRLILPFVGSDDISLVNRVEKAAEELFDRCSWQLDWQSDFRLHRRLSSTFAAGRIVLAGDAAHINSPVGGQGMNVGIQDASKLITIIDNALNSSQSDPFEEYNRKRRKEIRQGVNRFTDILTRLLLMAEGRMIRPVFTLINTVLQISPLRRKVMKRIARLE